MMNHGRIDLPRRKENSIKNANEKAAVYLESEILPVLKSSIEKELGQDADITIDEADSQTIVFRYPNIYESAYLSPSIRLEIGPLSAWTPTEKMEIRPYILEAFPAFFKTYQSVWIRCFQKGPSGRRPLYYIMRRTVLRKATCQLGMHGITMTYS